MSGNENNIEKMDKNDDVDYDYGKYFVLRILLNENNKEKWVHMWTYMLLSSLNISSTH